MGFEINSSYAEPLWFAASELRVWDEVFISSCVFSCAKMLRHLLFSRDSCRTVIYQGDLFGRRTSRCFQYLLQQERKCVLSRLGRDAAVDIFKHAPA